MQAARCGQDQLGIEKEMRSGPFSGIQVYQPGLGHRPPDHFRTIL